MANPVIGVLLTQPEPKRPHEGKIWELAVTKLLVIGKNATELKSKYRCMVMELGGKEQAFKEAKAQVEHQAWIGDRYEDE